MLLTLPICTNNIDNIDYKQSGSPKIGRLSVDFRYSAIPTSAEKKRQKENTEESTKITGYVCLLFRRVSSDMRSK
jgi:hypothetical protein